jgi:O-antigen ligase
MLISVPLSRAAGNISLMLLGLFSLLQFRKHLFFRVEYQLLLPVALFLLMLISLFWSIDFAETANALWKELTLFAIPVCFLLFPVFSKSQKTKILNAYAYGMAVLSVYYLVRAAVRFAMHGDPGVFFYHDLVDEKLNAIHVTVYMAVAFFAMLVKKGKDTIDKVSLGLLFLMILLLSSKNIIVVVFSLLAVYYLFYSGKSRLKKTYILISLPLLLAAVLLFTKVSDRFKVEYNSVMTDNTINEQLSQPNAKVYNMSVRQAWEQDKFEPNDFFAGTSFRVYQLRIFIEMLKEDHIFFTGYGLNASYTKVKSKAIEHNLYLGNGSEPGYQNKNFHDQYVQNFAELGIFGLLLLVVMLFVTLRNGIKAKDFVHISFAILMISLFLTESFLWRQRGVMFFTVLYCLFNSGIAYLAPRKRKKL